MINAASPLLGFGKFYATVWQLASLDGEPADQHVLQLEPRIRQKRRRLDEHRGPEIIRRVSRFARGGEDTI